MIEPLSPKKFKNRTTLAYIQKNTLYLLIVRILYT